MMKYARYVFIHAMLRMLPAFGSLFICPCVVRIMKDTP